MTSRAFTVFQDEPSVKRALPLGRSASASAVLMSTSSARGENTLSSIRSAIVPIPEKENFHPITGLGVGPTPASKKRKASESSSVLATKLLTKTSDSGASKAKRSELKRSASLSVKTKTKRESVKKGSDARKGVAGGDVFSSTQKTSSLSRRSPKTLEPVSEETEDPAPAIQASKDEAKNITQALIDARCYELTVSPLADVTDAYVQSSEASPLKKAGEVKDEDLPEYRTVKEESGFATQIRDYFSSEGSRSGSMSSFPSSSSVSTSFFDSIDAFDLHSSSFSNFESENNQDVPSTPKKLKRSATLPSTPTQSKEISACVSFPTLTTPERKELYASFTFTTPKSSPGRSR